jgi:RHH-type rel operon transcriptional repressor/antitoxin RelB
MQMLGVRLPAEIEQRLDALASETGRTKSFYVREAILEHLDNLEDIYMAEQVLERVRRGEERVYTSEEVERMFGLED